GPPTTVLLAILVCAATGTFVVLLTRRLLLAVVLTVAQVAVITTISSLKLKYMNMVLHAYDIAYYMMSSTNLSFLVTNYSSPVLAAPVGFSLARLVAVLAWSLDRVGVKRRLAAALLLVIASEATAAGFSVGERRNSLFQYKGMYVSSFYRSWAET